MSPSEARRQWLIPEIIQTSAMDCGPAALAALLRGLGVRASYDRLRTAGQTDVDGTSLDALEELAGRLGMEAAQVMVPAGDALFDPATALPAIAVVTQPNGLTHFVVLWRSHGGLVQCMDPAQGRRWLTRAAVLRQLYVHTMPVPAADWLEWARGDEFLTPLRARLRALGMPEPRVAVHLAEAAGADDWRPLARLDALARLAESLARTGGLAAGAEAASALERFIARAAEDSAWIPAHYWNARPHSPDEDGAEQVLLRGALMLRVRPGAAAAEEAETDSADLIDDRPAQPAQSMLRQLAADGALGPATIIAAALVASAGVILEEQLFRSALGPGGEGWAWLALPALTGALLLLNLLIARGSLWLARTFELGLRAAYGRKLPLLGDAYFRTRPISDLAERGHSIARLRLLVDLGRQLVLLAFELALTVAAIIWLFPAGAPLALGATALMVALMLVAQPVLWERDMRLRTHAGALGQFHLDTLLGLTALRVHRAERAVRWEHGALLGHWRDAGLRRARVLVGAETAIALAGTAGAATLVAAYLGGGAGDTAGALLLSYWALKLPLLGEAIAQLGAQYPTLRSTALRLLEPLEAPEEVPADGAPPPDEPAARGVALHLDEVTVVAGGRPILNGVAATIAPGEHVAIVGPSGAGKSTLAGLFLGWHQPATGAVSVDGRPLEPEGLEALRPALAWVDPAVQLWNRSLRENLRYGAPAGDEALLSAVEAAQLRAVLARLPEGLAAPLGEGGGLVSGGEGQRVRFARALLRPGVRLAILDEPFRGLDRDARAALLRTARHHWRDATLLCITHDVAETRSFPRVLVVEAGRIVEDGHPAELAARPGSRYGELLEAEAGALGELAAGGAWRRLTIEGGRIDATPGPAGSLKGAGHAER